MKRVLIIVGFIVTIIVSCTMEDRRGVLTDEKITNYCNAYKAMRSNTPDILSDINENGEAAKGLQEDYDSLEQIVKENGIKDFSDFIKLNAQIGAIYSILQGENGMEVSENMYDSGQEMFSDGEKLIIEQINDPDVPEDAKAELRVALEELKKGSEELSSSYKFNKVFADFTMEKVKQITGYIVNEHDIELVKKHEQEISDVYVGFKLPKGFDGKFPKFKID